MMFEGERCEANKNKNKKEETEKKEEDTLKHQQQGPNLFRAVSSPVPLQAKAPTN